MNGKVELLKAANGEWFYHVKAGNGRILVHSETYSSKSKAKAGYHSLVSHLNDRGFDNGVGFDDGVMSS